MRAQIFLVVMAIALAVTACGDETATTTVQASTSTEAAAPRSTTTEPPATTVATDPEPGFTQTEDIVYLDDGGRRLELDVYVPSSEGPHPVVVLFHGLPATKDDRNQADIAEAAAEAGMLVYVPNWNKTPSAAPEATDLRVAFATTACALAFAEETATSYGGNPNQVVVSGFSAGALEAAWLGLGHKTELPGGCVASTIAAPPVGAVLGDSEYFLHSDYFDVAFDTDLAEMQTIAAEVIDPAMWPKDLAATFRIWYAESSSRIRACDDPWDETGWLAKRDPDGSIRADLDQLGLLDDGIVSFIDESELLAYRLQDAGIDTTVDMYPGGHGVWDKSEEIVGYLLDAAT